MVEETERSRTEKRGKLNPFNWQMIASPDNMKFIVRCLTNNTTLTNKRRYEA